LFGPWTSLSYSPQTFRVAKIAKGLRLALSCVFSVCSPNCNVFRSWRDQFIDGSPIFACDFAHIGLHEAVLDIVKNE
jgi:hypothetical protein